MDKVIGKVIGTRKAGEDAEIIERDDGQVWVRWTKSGEIVRFESRAAADPWLNGNGRFIERVEMV